MKLSALMIGGFSAVAMVVAGCQTMPVPSRYKGEASNKGEAVAIAKVGCARKLDKYEYANQLNWKAEQMGGGRWYVEALGPDDTVFTVILPNYMRCMSGPNKGYQ